MCREICLVWKVKSREWKQTKGLPALHSELLGVVLLFWITRGSVASTKVTMTRNTDHCWIGVGWDHLTAEATFLDVRADIGKPCIYNSNKDSGQRTFSSKNLVKLQSCSARQGQSNVLYHHHRPQRSHSSQNWRSCLEQFCVHARTNSIIAD